MAIIEGDIDLTQNLDFYRKKPQKLLPANVSLKGRHDEPDSRLNIDNGSCYINTISSSNIQLYYNNNTERIYTLYRNRERSDYIDTYDDEPLFNSITISDSENYSDYSMTISSSNSISTTYTTRIRNINTVWEWMDDGWTTLKTKPKKFISSIEEKFKLWSARPKHEMIDSLHICYCYECGASFLSTSSSGKCKKCLREKQIKEKMNKVINKNRSGFHFNHIQRVDWYDGFDDIPWDIKPRGLELIRRHLYNLSHRKNREYRYGIPWFQELNTRIYDDYIEELQYGEKDYSSYLTNMGWIGIRRESSNNEGEIRLSNDTSIITTTTLNNQIIDSLETVEIREVHSDEELRDLSLSRRSESRHDDRIDSLITGWNRYNIIDIDDITYSV